MDKSKKQEMLAGVFIISGVILLLITLFVLGLSDLFAHKIIMRTGFSESVQGLSRGSAVKYRGVQIGNVTEISILVDENIIQVDMEIDPAFFAVNRHNNRFPDREFHAFFQNEIKNKGLRARLEMLGITGMKFIDFDYFAKPGTSLPAPPRFTGPRGVLYIPGVTSQMKDITGTLTMAVDRLSRIRFERISEQLETALTGSHLCIRLQGVPLLLVAQRPADDRRRAGDRADRVHPLLYGHRTRRGSAVRLHLRRTLYEYPHCVRSAGLGIQRAVYLHLPAHRQCLHRRLHRGSHGLLDRHRRLCHAVTAQ